MSSSTFFLYAGSNNIAASRQLNSDLIGLDQSWDDADEIAYRIDGGIQFSISYDCKAAISDERAFQPGWAFVAAQTAVKAKYKLWMTAAEHDAIARVLETCLDQPLPTQRGAPGQPVAVDAAPAPAVNEQPRTEAHAAPAGEISYADPAGHASCSRSFSAHWPRRRSSPGRSHSGLLRPGVWGEAPASPNMAPWISDRMSARRALLQWQR